MSASLESQLKSQARSEGFTLVGITQASRAETFEFFSDWLQKGYAAGMKYLPQSLALREHPQSILTGVHSVVMLGIPYGSEDHLDAHSLGKIARYAQVVDYHPFLWAKLNRLVDWLTNQVPNSISRGVTDTAPLLERDFARRAGLGWFGKNTMLIDKQQGSYFFLAALLTSIELTPDLPHVTSHCGTCTKCLEACPTGAFPKPYVLDANKCISYLTIEHRGEIPEDQRRNLNDWLFGCDVCQEVCPWNRHPSKSHLPLAERVQNIDLLELLNLSPSEFKKRFANTSLLRAKRSGLIRNAILILVQRKDHRIRDKLIELQNDPDEVIRQTAIWGLSQLEN